MSNRFAYLFGLFEDFSLGNLVSDFSFQGIELENSANRRTTALSPEGDQVDITFEALNSAINLKQPITFQFWMPRHADICCRIRPLTDDRLVEEYSLVGLNEKERTQVIMALIERFKSKAVRQDNLFFVSDSEGYTFSLDWDKLSLDGQYEFPLCPDILGIPFARMADFESCARLKRTTVGKYVLLSES